MKALNKIKAIFYESFTDNILRKTLIFKLLNIILFLVSGFMSIVNIITQEYFMLIITGVYSTLSLCNFLLVSSKRNYIEIIFFIETTALMAVFIISGQPEGFSALWTLLIPSCSLAIFGRKNGIIFSTIMLSVIIFLFWTPIGKDIINVESYTKTFMLRFPFVYVALFIIAFTLELIRSNTYSKLLQAEENYEWLSKHDELTTLFNRYGFYDEVKKLYSDNKSVSVLMIDIDDFKNINDIYGHNTGDEVLHKISSIILENTCEHCITCRWGGEEFLVVMNCEHNPEVIADQIRTRCSEATIVFSKNNEIKFTISIGISSGIISNEKSLTEQINFADKAMYISKNQGKNKITIN